MKNKLYAAVALLVLLCSAPVRADEPSAWATDEVARAASYGLVAEELQNSYTADITRAEFACSAVRLCRAYFGTTDPEILRMSAQNDIPRESAAFADLTGHPYSADIDCAYRLGIITGRSDTAFDPDSSVTREEAAVMLYRTYRVCGGTDIAQDGIAYTDAADIADWASYEVGQMSVREIVRGMGDGTFAPQGTYTREQCYLTLLRLFELSGAPAEEIPPVIEAETTENKVVLEEIETSYFVYELTDGGTLTVADYIGPEGIIVLQPKLDGYPVTSIAAGAFDGYAGLQVCVPDSVTDIEPGAFPTDIGGVYYESENGALKSHAEDNGLNAAPWVWEDVGHIPWARKDDNIERDDPVHGKFYNNDIAYAATTMIYCERSPEEDFDYTIEDDAVTVYGYHGDGKYVSIPETIEGYPVRIIGEGAFFEDIFKHLEIPKTVTEIQSYVCGMHTGVSTVHVLDGEDCTLGYNVFCGRLNHVRFHNNIKEIKVGERNKKYEPLDITIMMKGCIAPTTFEEENGFTLTIFVYPEE